MSVNLHHKAESFYRLWRPGDCQPPAASRLTDVRARSRCRPSAPRRRRARPRGRCRSAAGCGRACGRSRCPRSRSRAAPLDRAVASTESAKSMVATTWDRCAGSATNGLATRRLLGPVVEDAGGRGRALGGPGHAALAEHPVDLLGQHDQRRHGRGVVGLLQPGVVDRGLQGEELRDVAVAGRDLGGALQRGRREQREPEAAVGAEALLRGEVVSVELARIHGACRQQRWWRRRAPGRPSSAPRDPADRHGDAGRGLVMGERVGVDAGLGLRRQGACPALTRSTDGSASQGAACGHPGELGRELAEGQVLGRCEIKPNAADSQNAVVPPLPSTTR